MLPLGVPVVNSELARLSGVAEDLPLAIVDIDGVVADVRHRVHYVEQRPKDWKRFFAAAVRDEPHAEVLTLLRRAAGLSRELGLPGAPLDLELDDDPLVAGYQAMVAAPLGPADRQRLLAAPTLADRFELLVVLLGEQIEVLQAELAFGGGEQ